MLKRGKTLFISQILQCAFMNELRANPAESSVLYADKMFRYEVR